MISEKCIAAESPGLRMFEKAMNLENNLRILKKEVVIFAVIR